jgi:hypothetical protein
LIGFRPGGAGTAGFGTVAPVSRPSSSASTAAPAAGAPARKGRRSGCALLAIAVLAGAGYVGYRQLTGGPREASCTARGTGGRELRLDPEQAADAATIAAVGTARGLPERAVTIALATSLQESTLHTLDHGDRDSMGLFQQRASQGWGTAAQIMDPVHSSGAFYAALVKVPHYTTLPLTDAAQQVQKSGYPEAYAKHEDDAALLAAALTGRRAGALSCVEATGGATAAPASPAADDKAGGSAGSAVAVSHGRALRAELVREFGRRLDPGPAGGTLEVPVPGATTTAGRALGWQVAQWAVAHADAYHVHEVAFAGHVWSSAASPKGWRALHGPAADDAPAGEVRVTVGR